jgi:DNA polymerase-3 subunit epsilon
MPEAAEVITTELSAPTSAASHSPGTSTPTPALVATTEPAPPPASDGTDWEALARQLEHHPDYRVLRRLAPTLHFDRAPQGPLCQVLVLDTETTGLDGPRDKLMELALLRVAVDTTTGLPVGEVQVYDGLEDPGRPIPAAITGITGITDAMVHDQRLDEARIAELTQGVDLVVAHNAGFDRPFVEARLPAFAQLAWACSLADLDWKARGQGSARLESLALACGWFYSAHRAETDCHALLGVLSQPLASFGPAPDGTPPESEGTGLLALMTAAHQTHHRLQATGAPFEAKDLLKARGYRWDAQQRVWSTTLRSESALAAELAWLADAVYGGQASRVRVEALDAQQRYSLRAGVAAMRVASADLLLG